MHGYNCIFSSFTHIFSSVCVFAYEFIQFIIFSHCKTVRQLKMFEIKQIHRLKFNLTDS